ncbi:MAG: isoprenylcysteine carboxylmethyltransferase family protein [Desulfobacterales bacterium]|jgi:protein-S-isoprenylcysteine O-methyltransferase Ste14
MEKIDQLKYPRNDGYSPISSAGIDLLLRRFGKIIQALIKNNLVGSSIFALIVLFPCIYYDFKRILYFDLQGVYVLLDVIIASLLIVLILIRSRAKHIDVSLGSIVAVAIGGGGAIILGQFHLFFYDQLMETKFAPFFLHFSLYKQISSPLFDLTVLSLLILMKMFIVLSYISLGRSFSVFPAARTLKTNGIYQYFRHPIYTIFILKLVIYNAVISLSWFNLIAIFLITSMMLYRVNLEEKILIEAFGDQYREYQKRVKKFGIL